VWETVVLEGAMMQQTNDERSLGELFGDLARDMGTLVSQELALARTELTDKASRVGKDVAMLAAGGLVAYAGLLAIIAAVIVLIAERGVPLWVSALVVGLVVAGIGYVLIRRGISALKHEDFAPRQTIQSLKEDTQWVKEQVR
jgi:xanthine/uracil permease